MEMMMMAMMLIFIFVPVILITCIGLILDSLGNEELSSMGIDIQLFVWVGDCFVACCAKRSSQINTNLYLRVSIPVLQGHRQARSSPPPGENLTCTWSRDRIYISVWWEIAWSHAARLAPHKITCHCELWLITSRLDFKTRSTHCNQYTINREAVPFLTR